MNNDHCEMVKKSYKNEMTLCKIMNENNLSDWDLMPSQKTNINFIFASFFAGEKQLKQHCVNEWILNNDHGEMVKKSYLVWAGGNPVVCSPVHLDLILSLQVAVWSCLKKNLAWSHTLFSSRTPEAKALKVLIMSVSQSVTHSFFFANFLHIPNSYLSDDPNQSSQVIFQKKSQFSNLLFRFLISMIIWILKKRCLNLISDNVNN